MALITTLIVLTVFLLKISVNKNVELNNYKSIKQVSPKINIKNNSPKKNSNQYSDVIHIVNKYNGEIKELTAKNGNLINTDVLVIGDEKRLSDFLGELMQYKNLKNFNSITLDDTSGDTEKYSIDVNAEFNTTKK